MSATDDLIYSAIGLTSQADCYALTQYLLGLLHALSFVGHAGAFEIYTRRDGKPIFRRFTDNLDEERIPPDEPGLAECMERKMPVEVMLGEGKTRLVFPVESGAGPMRLVAMDGREIEPEDRVMLLHLMTLYRNQVNVLDGKERDTLTGLLNRQTFNLRLMQVTELRRLKGGLAWLAALDIDHFKRVNDTYGHLYGDEVLLHFAQLMQRHFRYTDFLFRFGGEEFIVLLTHASAKGAAEAMERFRLEVASYDFPAVGQVTVSTGYTVLEAGVLPTTLVDRADQALYNAKETGRNRVVSYAEIRGAEQESDASDIELF